MFNQKLLLLTIIYALFFIPQSDATSLYSKDKFKSLTADKRAKKIGDTVTVIVLENSQASSSKSNQFDSGFSVQGIGSDSFNNRDIQLGLGSQADGDAKTARNGYIKSQITAVVTKVDSNGNLFIEGRQTITIDGEKQTIEVTGRARQSDIFANNTLLSSRLFDADIKFIGMGELTENASPGLIYRALKWLGLV